MSKVVMAHGQTSNPVGHQVFTAKDIHESVPFLSRYLRHLVVSTSAYLLRSEDANRASFDAVFYALITSIPHFTRLSRISLTGDAMFKLLSSTQVDLSNISHFTVYRPGRILQIKTIRAFTHLRVLHLIGISLDPNEAAIAWSRDPSDTNPIPVLEELALQLAPIPFDIFVNWVCRTETLDFSQLKTLKISTGDGEAERKCFLNHLAPLVGTNLQTLDLDFYSKSVQLERQ